MTRMDLNRAYWLSKDLLDIREKLRDLEADIALGNKQYDGMPRSATNAITRPVEDKAIKLLEVSRLYEEKIIERQYALIEVNTFIAGLDDPLLRIILNHRCCKAESWKEVSKSVGHGYTAESVRQIYSRFVKGLPA